VCTRQCPVRQRLQSANGRLHQIRKEIRTGQCPVVHRIVKADADPNGCNLADADPNGCDPARAEPNECDLADADPNGCDPAKAEPNGCDPVPFIVRIVDEDEEEEEEEVPLIQKNSRCYRVNGGSSDIPSLALSALVGLQELSIANFD
jgi:hypothetical protein